MRYTTVGVFHGVVAVANVSNPAQTVLVTKGYETTVAYQKHGNLPGTARHGRNGSARLPLI